MKCEPLVVLVVEAIRAERFLSGLRIILRVSEFRVFAY